MRWLLAPADGGNTLVCLEHRGWAAPDGELAQCSFVWGQVLARLGQYAATGEPEPFFRRTA